MRTIAMNRCQRACRLAQAVGLVGFLFLIPGVQAAAQDGQLANDLRGPMSVSAAPRSHEPKEQHANRHADVDKALAREEANCYQRFAVNRCLLDARAQARAERAVLDERERAEKAANRQARSEALQRERALRQTGQTGALPGENDANRSRAKPQPRAVHEGSKAKQPPRAAQTSPPSDIQPLRDKRTTVQARREQSASVQTQRDERAAAQLQRDERAGRARARLLDKRAAADRRQASIEERRQLREANGRVPPMPLPPGGIKEAF